jgi:antitoxin HicB
MHYYAHIVKTDDACEVSFPEFPHVNTYGETLDEALSFAEEALNGCLEVDFSRGFSLPDEKVHSGRNYHAVVVRPHIAVAYMLRRLRDSSSQEAIAQKMGISAQAYQRLENPRRCNPTIKTLEKLSDVFGVKLDLSFSDISRSLRVSQIGNTAGCVAETKVKYSGKKQ